MHVFIKRNRSFFQLIDKSRIQGRNCIHTAEGVKIKFRNNNFHTFSCLSSSIDLNIVENISAKLVIRAKEDTKGECMNEH